MFGIRDKIAIDRFKEELCEGVSYHSVFDVNDRTNENKIR